MFTMKLYKHTRITVYAVDKMSLFYSCNSIAMRACKPVQISNFAATKVSCKNVNELEIAYQFSDR